MASWYFQTIVLLAGSTSITRENGNVWSRRCGPLSNITLLPLGSTDGACWPEIVGDRRVQTTPLELRSILMMVEMLRKLTTRFPSSSSTTAFPCVHSERGFSGNVIGNSAGSRWSHTRHSHTVLPSVVTSTR